MVKPFECIKRIFTGSHSTQIEKGKNKAVNVKIKIKNFFAIIFFFFSFLSHSFFSFCTCFLPRLSLFSFFIEKKKKHKMLILRHNTLSAEDLFTIECVSFFFFQNGTNFCFVFFFFFL
jgi:hypothetical protein